MRAVHASAGPLAPLLKAPQTGLNAGIGQWRRRPNGDWQAEIEVQNTGSQPALFVKLGVEEFPGAHAYVEDNYFFLPPKESRRMRVSLATAQGRQPPAAFPIVHVGPWNSKIVEVRNVP